VKMSLPNFMKFALIGLGVAGPALAQDPLTLTSPAFETGGALPDDLKCQRDNGNGLSPPLAWTGVPAGTQSLALIMYHYPKGTAEGVNSPSQYWLLWDIPVDTAFLPRGNPGSIGNEGSDKDTRATGFTPPCSPKPWFSIAKGPQHQYFIELFALNAPLALPAHDDLSIDWAAMITAMKDKVVTSSRISFWN
jgi:phosphatidylethanolamine-binding protein (PEBP) family uncharacterized protein